MYKILLSFAFVLLGFIASAQFTPGSILLGGQLSFGNSKTTNSQPLGDQTNNYGDVAVSIGKAIKENTVFGVILSYSGAVNKINSSINYTDASSNSYGIAVFYRKYKSLGKDFYLFGELNAGYAGGSQTQKDSLGNKLYTYTTNGGNIGLYPGMAYKVSKKLFLELSIPQLFTASYGTQKTTFPLTEPSKTNSFGIAANLNSNPLESFGIGFRLDL